MDNSYPEGVRKFAVKVNNGSGCLFQTPNNLSSYVLTARHNLIENTPPRHLILENVSVTLPRMVPDREQDQEICGTAYLHPQKDAALIVIPQQKVVPEYLTVHDNAKHPTGNNFWLIGFPESRKNMDDPYRADPVKILDKKNHGCIECQLGGNDSKDEITGMSGGGVIRMLPDGLYELAGIQQGMAAADVKELKGRILIMPSIFFKEIATQNNLSPLTNSLEHTRVAEVQLSNCIIYELSFSYIRPEDCDRIIKYLVELIKIYETKVPSYSEKFEYDKKVTTITKLKGCIEETRSHAPVDSLTQICNHVKSDFVGLFQPK